MDTARILAQAAGAWLQYEFACGRASLFNERYLSSPIANALHSVYKKEVHSEYLHPVLAPKTTGPGRRPEVDFAVVNNFPAIECVVETKWVGKNGLSAEEVIWDLLRLELIAHHSGAHAFFLMAGRKKHLDSFFRSKAFLGATNHSGKHRKLLKIDSAKTARLRVDNPPKDRIATFQKLLSRYQDVTFGSRVTTSAAHRYPENCPSFQYQALAWEIKAPTGTARFTPMNHSLYRLATPGSP